jgi:hypothetical protein
MIFVTGWFECYGEDGLIYTTKESWDKGNPYNKEVFRLSDITGVMHNKKIKIIIEEVKE